MKTGEDRMTNSTPSLKAVVFDWAGTLVDFGSLAPMDAFVRLFERHGVAISVEEARIPMGLPKWHHIKELGRLPRVAEAWQSAHGRAFCDSDVDRLHEEFTPMSARSAQERAQPIPAAIEVIEYLRAQGLRVGSTTGYTRAIMDGVVAQAHEHGLMTDNLVCADDLPEGRPGPLGMYRCFIDLRVWPAHAVVKVDDTVPGLMEGRHAGCWTVAVAASGNAMGLDEKEWSGLSAGLRQALLQKAHLTLEEAQPDFIVDTVADLPKVVAEINRLLSVGQLPRPLASPVAAKMPA